MYFLNQFDNLCLLLGVFRQFRMNGILGMAGFYYLFSDCLFYFFLCFPLPVLLCFVFNIRVFLIVHFNLSDICILVLAVWTIHISILYLLLWVNIIPLQVKWRHIRTSWVCFPHSVSLCHCCMYFIYLYTWKIPHDSCFQYSYRF